jgi:excisionase family DNA binding protein
MRSGVSAFPASRSKGLAGVLSDVETAAACISSSSEALDCIARAVRVQEVLRLRLAALSGQGASSPASEVPRYLDAAAAAAYLGVSRSTLRRLILAKKVPAIHPSEGVVRFDREQLDRFMAGPAGSASRQ